MVEKSTTIAVTPGQAQWIVERMIADGRLSAADVRTILAAMGEEIAELEQRLALLQEARGDTPVAPQPPRTERTPGKARKRRGRRRTKALRTKASGRPRGIFGTLVVLLRSVPVAEHAAIQAIRADQGIRAAINAAQRAVKT